MGVGCQHKEKELRLMRKHQSRVLKIALALNAAMFIIEMATGILSGSNALKADALDMFGDALAYGFSLYVVAQSMQWKARASLLKGGFMAFFGLAVAAETLWRVLFPMVPESFTMSSIGVLALLVNITCLYLLNRHKNDDINMTSVWLCSRNDIFANVGIIVASAGVFLTHSQWPDVFVGAVIACLFLQTSVGVIRDSYKHLNAI